MVLSKANIGIILGKNGIIYGEFFNINTFILSNLQN